MGMGWFAALLARLPDELSAPECTANNAICDDEGNFRFDLTGDASELTAVAHEVCLAVATNLLPPPLRYRFRHHREDASHQMDVATVATTGQ
jgi:hypothetical protein